MTSATLQLDVLDRKIKVLTMPSLVDVHTVQVVYDNISQLIQDIDTHIKSDNVDSGTARLLQRRRLQLEKERVRCAEYLDEKGYLLVNLSESLQEDVDRILETKKGLHSKLAALDRECKALFGSSRCSVSLGAGSALTPGTQAPIAALKGVPVGPKLLGLRSASSTSSAAAEEKVDSSDALTEALKTSSMLFQRAHRLLLKYEQAMNAMQKITLASASGSAAVALDQAHDELKKEVLHVISIMRRILGSPVPVPPPRLPSHECPACHARGDYYCPKCTTRHQKHYEKFALKKCATTLIQQRNAELRKALEEGPIDRYREWLQSKTEFQMKQDKVAEMRRKIEELRAQLASKKARIIQRDEEIKRMEESNKIFEEDLKQRRSTIEQLEAAANASSESRAKKESMLAALRREKVRQLMSIMPVRADPTRVGRTVLMNIALRDDGIFETSVPTLREDPEITAVSLGNLVRLLKILGKYLNVNYPFQMRFNGSQSVIWLDGSENRYILSETRAPNRDNFKVAMKRLRLNVYCLCFSQGLVIRGLHPEHNMLKNMQLLLQRSEILGWERPKFVEINPATETVKTITSPSNLARSMSSSSTSLGMESAILSASDTKFTSVIASDAAKHHSSTSINPQITDLAGSPPRRDSHDGEIIADPLEEFVHVEFRAPHPDDPLELQHFMKAHADHGPLSSVTSTGPSNHPGSPGRGDEEDDDAGLYSADL